MTIEQTELIFYAIAGLMGLVWVVGTIYAMSRLGPRPPTEDVLEYRPDAADVDAITGEATVPGAPEEVSKKLAERLVAAGSLGGMSLLKITARTSSRISFERPRGLGAGGLVVFDSGEITLAPEGERVRVRYLVRTRRFASIMRMITYLVSFVWGGLFVFGTPLLIWYLVVHSENENVRGQVWQTFQMVHGVWPPFLIGALSSRMRRVTANYFETLIANLEHLT